MSNEIMKSEFQFPMVTNDDDGLEENIEGLSMSFDRVKIPTGGGLVFEVPGDDPDNPEMVSELVGVIIDHHPVHTYWKRRVYTGESSPPDCISDDGITGVGDPGGECRICPMFKWGSGIKSVGRACKTQRYIYLLREGDGLPLLLTLPPTSIKNFNDYLAKRILTRGRKTYSVITKVILKRAKSRSGITYSEAHFSVVRDLNADERAQAIEYARSMRKFTRNQSVNNDEFGQVEELPF